MGRGTLAFVLCFAIGASAAAQDLRYVAQAGDSLDGLAKHYYGATWKSAYIAAKNGIGDGAPAPGKGLTIPSCWVYTVKKGDSLGKLAKKYLGDTERFGILQAENALASPDIQPGFELLMPMVLLHVVQPGDSLSGIAQRYFRNRKKAQLLADFNGAGEKLDPGQKLLVPIFDRAALDLRARGAPPKVAHESKPAAKDGKDGKDSKDAKAPAAAAKSNESTEPQLLMKLDELLEAYEAGEYEAACNAFERLVTRRELATAERAIVLRQLAFCAVAFEDIDAARDYMKKWLEMDPKAQLDRTTTSPRVLAIFDDVRRD